MRLIRKTTKKDIKNLTKKSSPIRIWYAKKCYKTKNAYRHIKKRLSRSKTR